MSYQKRGLKRPKQSKKQVHQRQVFLVLFLLLMMVAVPLQALGASLQSASQVVVLNAEGSVTPAMASYLERGVRAAEEQGIPAVVVLNTPGGGIETTQEIVRLFRNAQVPVIVYVGPPGAQAASAGSIITLAAHASGMAPETVIGAASPVGGEGEDIGETMYRKVVEDLKASVRSLAARRGEEAVTLAEQMIEDARAVHATEALDAGLIDAVAPNLSELLIELDGLTVTVGEQEWMLQTAGAEESAFDMSTVEAALHAISNPLLLSILLPLGMTSLFIELRSPGGWVAGFIGVISLGIAFYGLGQLPVNWLGLGLMVVAFVLFLLEVTSPGVGALALAGAGTMLAGLLVLFNSPGSPEFVRISISSAVAITVVTSGFFLFILTMALQAQRRPAQTGKEGLVGKTGHVRKSLVPAPSGPVRYVGSVLVYGELWRAESDEAIESGEEVVVTGADGFTLHVQPVSVESGIGAK